MKRTREIAKWMVNMFIWNWLLSPLLPFHWPELISRHTSSVGTVLLSCAQNKRGTRYQVFSDIVMLTTPIMAPKPRLLYCLGSDLLALLSAFGIGRNSISLDLAFKLRISLTLSDICVEELSSQQYKFAPLDFELSLNRHLQYYQE